MGVLVVIPARYGSTRFPGKPLATLQGKPVIQHVYEQASRAARAEEVVVATDDQRILEAVESFGGRAVMTSPAARSGTERVAEVARTRPAPVIINVQGDEPLVRSEMVDELAACLEEHRAIPMASLMTRLRRCEDVVNPNVVKVVVDLDGFALYFSRAPIPHVRRQTSDTRHETSDLRPERSDASSTSSSAQPESVSLRSHVSGLMSEARYWKHLGIYGYQRHFLLRFPYLPPTPLEQLEQLEQLRALEHGYRIKLLETAHDTVGVDTPDDLARVDALLSRTA